LGTIGLKGETGEKIRETVDIMEGEISWTINDTDPSTF
jgi:hypothetical protein